ncbi:MAG: phage excisionase [Tardiphaga sp.]|jgi:excisionase family DNA binding protein|nr:phage excisionase [Tardiphaga sp.]
MTNKRTLSIAEFCKNYGVGRTMAYEEIKARRLRAIKVGQRTLIIVDDAEAWLLSRPSSHGADPQDARHG